MITEITVHVYMRNTNFLAYIDYIVVEKGFFIFFSGAESISVNIVRHGIIAKLRIL